MRLSRGVLRYGLYFFIGAWMFALGVIVGRGTSPVNFDTSSFQERLRVIVGEIPKEAPETQKVDLDFYTALNKPAASDTAVSPAPLQKAPPVVEKTVPKVPEEDGEVPVKYSRKFATLDRAAAAEAVTAEPKKDSGRPEKKTPRPVKKKASEGSAGKGTETEVKAAQPKAVPQGDRVSYTIQVAAYREFKDAVTQMSLLKEKGIASYRTRGEAGGTTWYRVRTGTFTDFQSAQAELNRLKEAKINGMIIKKDDQ